jgi:hypothetical protein
MNLKKIEYGAQASNSLTLAHYFLWALLDSNQ